MLLAHTEIQKIKVKTVSLSSADLNRNNITGGDVALNARLSFSTRPCSPLESLVLGLISVTEGQTAQNQKNEFIKKRHAIDQNINSVHGQTDTIHVPYIDPYTVATSRSKEIGNFLGIEKYLPTLRSLIITYCPSRPLAGMYVQSHF